MSLWLRTRLAPVMAAMLVAAGCGEAPPGAAPPSITVAPPTPAGMQVRTAVPPPGPEDKSDCTASLRPFPTPEAAAAAVTNIKDRGRLIVGLDVGSNLFAFRDPISGQITGFDVDIAGEVARDIFGTPSQVEYRILSDNDRISALQHNLVDIVVKTMSITCERRKLVNFSAEYFSAKQRILTTRGSDITKPSDLSGKRVCVVPATTSKERLERITPPPILVEAVTWADCLVALQQRQTDAVSTDDAILAGLVAQDPYLHIVGPNMAEEPYGIGINLENTGLVRFVNGTLERIRRDGTWNTLYRKWLTVLGSTPYPPVPRYSD
ncbi:ABC transporter substrate-binding protein [Mycobacterium sp. CBMA 234]|uniref:glutamate ABC transporter substrate-binding protein n=1 Tax=Mycolicibacterium sp. CBMA 234 TaxID=1918495 RepID=UPI0012DF77CF|nr:glutamate ABC transporter substrate-binding protein [Mycolicibacterium sp. CBMA 234]MUL66377.1 ABC transporter substrate-binding protein [Mycolicibacterium sp. CBMA 234]